jgi:type VI secretion system secreted protein VgrG
MPSEPTPYVIVFLAEGVPPEACKVRRFVAEEHLSRPYAVEVDIEIPDGTIEPRAWILTAAQVVVLGAANGEVSRRYTGFITRVRERASRRGDRQYISVTLEAPLCSLRFSRDHRIFQNQTTQQIVKTLLTEAGIDAAKVDYRIAATLSPREVCTQFDEETLTFVSRLLEEDGIFYFFEHHDDGPLLVFGDSSAAFASLGADEVSYVAESGMIGGFSIGQLSEWERLRPAKVTLRDHDFTRPSQDLEAKAESSAPLGREHYAYPGRYVKLADGKTRAQHILESFAAESGGLVGTGTAFAFAPGHTFSLTNTPDGSLDGAYVIREARLTWKEGLGERRESQAAQPLRNEFTLLPKSVPFRPSRTAPRSVVRGPHVAKVVGPPGEEIHCDEYGRVKLMFPWDRRATGDDKSSGWVRVGQLHTSGSVAIPRIGWEVLVEYEDGDPDRPIVVGRLYNGKYPPPYALPANKTRTAFQSASTPGGGGGNEIKMEDSSGGEGLKTFAQKDTNVATANNKTEKVANNATHDVGSNHKVTIGGSETVSVGAGASLGIGASQSWTVGGSRSKTISGGETVSVGASRSVTIGGSHTTTTPMTVSVSTTGSLTETVGGSCIEAAALGVAMSTAGAASITVGGSKLEAVATGKKDVTVGAKASTVGGAFISASGADVGFTVGGAKATTVGGAFAVFSGDEVALTSKATLRILVGGAVSMNAASIELKVGGSKVSIATGGVTIKTTEIKLTATGPQPETSVLVGEK